MLIDLSLVDLVEGVRSGKISAESIMLEVYNRIEQYNCHIKLHLSNEESLVSAPGSPWNVKQRDKQLKINIQYTNINTNTNINPNTNTKKLKQPWKVE